MVLEPPASPRVPATAPRKLDTRVVGVGEKMGAVQILHLLTQSVSGDLIGAADEAETDNPRSVSCSTHAIGG